MTEGQLRAVRAITCAWIRRREDASPDEVFGFIRGLKEYLGVDGFKPGVRILYDERGGCDDAVSMGSGGTNTAGGEKKKA